MRTQYLFSVFIFILTWMVLPGCSDDDEKNTPITPEEPDVIAKLITEDG